MHAIMLLITNSRRASRPPDSQRLKVESEVRVADVHRIFTGFRHSRIPRGYFDLEDAAVDVSVSPSRRTGAGFASLSVAVASPQPTTAGMPSSRAMMARGGATPRCDDGCARFITGSPVGVGHVRYDDVAGFDARHLRGSLDTRTVPPDLGPMAGRGEDLGLCFRGSLLPSADLRDFTVSGLACRCISSRRRRPSPLDVHGALVMLLDPEREARELDHVFVAEAKAVRSASDTSTVFTERPVRLLGKHHFLQFRAETAPDHRELPPRSIGLWT